MLTRKWQNAAGASLDNSVALWCFATGELELPEIGASLKYTNAEYVDHVNRPPGKAPKIDF